MSQQQKVPYKTDEELANALDEALDHIAGAHRLVEAVRMSAQARPKSSEQPYLRDVNRLWYTLDTAGLLCNSLHAKTNQ